MQTFDAVVLGLGTMGSFTCMELSRRGLRVAGIDRFKPPHGRGSHSGDTRVFRIAYAEHPDYVPLAQRSEKLWREYGQRGGKTLLTQSGMMSMGPAECSLISGIRASSAIHGLGVEEMSRADLEKAFPVFVVPNDFVGVVEKSAGWIDVDAAICFALGEAERAGATLFFDDPVSEWRQSGKSIFVQFGNESIETAHLVTTAGAWTGALLRDLKLKLSIRRKVLVWFDPLSPELFGEKAFPVFAIGDEFFYGFPNLLSQGVKLAIHWGQDVTIDDLSVPVTAAGETDIAPVLRKASQYLPRLGGNVSRTATCLYTMTPDEHFLVGRHPLFENVFLASGFSGHGFKFAPAIGEALADYCTTGRAALPALFNIQRFVD